MNLFRLAGDLCHVLSFAMLFLRLHKSRSAKGACSRSTGFERRMTLSAATRVPPCVQHWAIVAAHKHLT